MDLVWGLTACFKTPLVIVRPRHSIIGGGNGLERMRGG